MKKVIIIGGVAGGVLSKPWKAHCW